MALLYEIQVKFAANLFELSKHAVDQSILRNISINEIKEALKLLNITQMINTDQVA